MIELLAFAFMCAAATCFIQYCISEGQILSFYGLWLETIPKFIAKPLGLCAYCSNFWLTVFLYISVYGFDMKLWLAAGASYIFLSAIIELNID